MKEQNKLSDLDNMLEQVIKLLVSSNWRILTITFGVPALAHILYKILVNPIFYRIYLVFADGRNWEMEGFVFLLIFAVVFNIAMGLVCGFVVFYLTKQKEFSFISSVVFFFISFVLLAAWYFSSVWMW